MEKTSKDQADGQHRPRLFSFSPLNIDADKVLSAYGTFGKYQITSYFLAIAPCLLYAANMMVMPFITEEVQQFSCQLINHSAIAQRYDVIDRCTVYDSVLDNNVTCLSLIGEATYFDYRQANDGKQTLSKEFNLVCENDPAREHGSSFFLAGGMLASMLMSKISDARGRRMSFLISIWLATASNLCISLSPNYIVFLLLRAISGFGAGGNMVVGMVLGPELVAPSFRDYSSLVATIFWVLGYMLAGVAAIICNHWRWMYFVVSAPGFLTIPYICVVMNLTYWALSLFSTELSEKKMIGFFLSGLIEIPAGIVSVLLLKSMRRVLVSTTTVGLTGICLLLGLALPLLVGNHAAWFMIFPLLAKMFNSIAWASVPLSLTEMTPTFIRNTFTGYIAFCGDFGSIFSPYLGLMKSIHHDAATYLICILSIVSALLVLLQPETKGKSMVASISEFDGGPLFDVFGKKNSKRVHRKTREVSALKKKENKTKIMVDREEEGHGSGRETLQANENSILSTLPVKILPDEEASEEPQRKDPTSQQKSDPLLIKHGP